jgi:hypothetical protein
MIALLRKLHRRIKYRRFEADLVEELALHRDLKLQEGAIDIDRAMGNELRMREAAYDVWVPPSVDSIRQDVRDAFRVVRRRPGFSMTVIAVLVVGATTSLVAFSLVDALLLKPLPVERPDQLVYLRAPSFSMRQITGIQRRSTLLSDSFAWNLTQYDVAWGSERQPSLVMVA